MSDKVNPFAAEEFGVTVPGGEFVVKSRPYGGTAALKVSEDSDRLDPVTLLNDVVFPFLVDNVEGVANLEFRDYPKSKKAREAWWRELPMVFAFAAESSIRYGRKPKASPQEDTVGKSNELDA